LLRKTQPFPPYAQQQRDAERETTTTIDKGHGRLERRTLTSTTALNLFVQRLGWSSVRQVFRVTRECAWTDRETGELRTSHEEAYGITDLTRTQAHAPRLLHFNRGHWQIENGVFYVRDEAFGEDRSRVRRGSAPEVLAGLRNAALNLLRLAGSTNISASLRSCAWNLQHVRNLLGIVN
jgi:predicted transposase YbfD/YdcC